jgi:DNA-binding NarL/FixJ family response regulator
MTRVRGYSDHAMRRLTPRMVDVLRAAASGRTALETALELGVSEQTIKSERAAACARLQVPNTIAAVAAAIRSGAL